MHGRGAGHDDGELMRLHVEALFVHDGAGRLLRTNEPGGRMAPRFYLGRTGRGSLWRFRHDLEAALVEELEAMCATDERRAASLDSPSDVEKYERVLATAAPIERIWTGPAYRFPSQRADGPANAMILRAGDDVDLLRPLLAAWIEDVVDCQPFVIHVEDGKAVAVCCSVRRTADAHEAGVETAAAYRHRGHAAHVTAAWATAVRALGAVPLYSTSWDNVASRALAARLGLVCYGIDLHIT